MVVYIITMVPSLVPKDDIEQKASTKLVELREALKKYGGSVVLPVLLGDCTVVASKSMMGSSSMGGDENTNGNGKNSYLGPYDVLITKHRNIEDYKLATRSDMYQQVLKSINDDGDSGDKKENGKNINNAVRTFGFENKSIKVDWVLPALKTIYNLFWKGRDSSVDSKLRADQHMEVDMYQADVDKKGLQEYKTHIANHPGQKAYMLSLHTYDYDDNKSLPDGKNAAYEYEKGFFKSAFTDDVNVSLEGDVISLDDGPKMFQYCTVVEFPSREVFVRWIESDYHKTLNDKYRNPTFVLDKFDLLCIPMYG